MPAESAAISALLSPNLAPAAVRHALAREDGARGRGIAGLALVLRASTALLTRFERWVGFGVDLGSIADESQGLGGRIVRIEGW
jgi:hypothetical protein